jgi:aspartyl-tRNA(Asn)/glutamyl-tRNA(Gln) amidotransferase subunit C
LEIDLMALSHTDVARLARLARLDISPQQQSSLSHELNQVMALIESLQSIQTDGVEPLAHPLSAIEEVQLRLRDDVSLPTNAPAERDRLMQNAPAMDQGVFLVPRVIE